MAGLISITGATGFLGPYVVREARKRGHQVRLLARTPSKAASLEGEGVEVIKGDLSTIPNALVDGADIVIHMAALIKAPTKDVFFDVNEGGVARMASAAQTAGVSKFVYLSSQAASQPQLSGYSASKYAGEAALSSEFTGDHVIIRAPAVFGPGDEATKPFFTSMLKGFLPFPGGWGWRKRRIAMIYAPDLARHILDEAESGDSGKITYPATISALSWTDFVHAARCVTHGYILPVPIPMLLIAPIAAFNSLFLRKMFNPHLTLGKLREFRYEDWSVDQVIDSATPFTKALAETFASYKTK